MWKHDPWVPGITLALPEQVEADVRSALSAAGWSVECIPYAVADWVRWKWRRTFLDGRRVPDIWRNALAALPARVAKAGPAPSGWRWVEPIAAGGLAYNLPARLAAGSKRRLPDPVRAPPASMLPAALSSDDDARAVIALREHAETLAPALALAPNECTRLRIAFAFARLLAGEIDHVVWLDVLASARRNA